MIEIVSTTQINAERFEKWIRRNRLVLPEFIRISLEDLQANPDKRLGSSHIWEKVRKSGVVTEAHPYRLDNTFKPLVVRRAMEIEPRLRGMFETRKLAERPVIRTARSEA